MIDDKQLLGSETYAFVEGHIDLVARSLTRHIRRTVPRYAEIELDAHTRDVAGLLKVMGPIFRREEPTDLLRSFGELARMRIIEGVEVDDFVAATLCILPTLRAFFSKYCESRKQASRMYGEVERVIIPFLGRCARMYVVAMEDQSVTLDQSGATDLWRASTIAYLMPEASDEDVAAL